MVTAKHPIVVTTSIFFLTFKSYIYSSMCSCFPVAFVILFYKIPLNCGTRSDLIWFLVYVHKVRISLNDDFMCQVLWTLVQAVGKLLWSSWDRFCKHINITNIGIAIEVQEQCTVLLAISHDYSVVGSAI